MNAKQVSEVVKHAIKKRDENLQRRLNTLADVSRVEKWKRHLAEETRQKALFNPVQGQARGH